MTPSLDGTVAPISASPPNMNALKSSPIAKSPDDEEDVEATALYDDVDVYGCQMSGLVNYLELNPLTIGRIGWVNSIWVHYSSAPSLDANAPLADAAPAPSSAGKSKASLGLFAALASMIATY
ncbi:hypothetical protein FXO38_06061 [Capsicum annuum]|nr:hypothetical protein FXO37_15425 [Capsicum annuum]KAF3672547.1 hypothetical protein FXO38_06061 [Capsicum annuum]